MNVLVLGIQHSGTDLLTRALQAAGLAGNLNENPEFLVERPDVAVLNDRFLASLGWTRDAPDPAPQQVAPLRTEHVQDGRSLVEWKLKGSQPWVLTDPGISLLLPWWRLILDDDFIAIVVVREPKEVAAIFGQVDRMLPELAYALWAAYYRHLASGLRGLTTIGISYAALRATPASVLRHLSRVLTERDASLRVSSRAAARAVRDTNWTLGEATPSPESSMAANPSVKTLQKIWLRTDALWVQKSFAGETVSVTATERWILRAQRKLVAERQRAAQWHAVSNELSFERDVLERQRNSLQHAVASLEETKAELERSDAEHSVRISAMKEENRRLKSSLEGLRITTDELRAEAEAARVEAAEHMTEADALRREIRTLETDLLELRAETANAQPPVRSNSPLPHGIVPAVQTKLLRAAVRVLPSSVLAYVWHNPLFDAGWYLNTYGDVRSSGSPPELHFRRHGVEEGRDPNPVFDTSWYLANYADVALSGINPLDHYLLFGSHEGRDPSPHFSTSSYLAQHPDVSSMGLNPLLHFLRQGVSDGRHAHAAAEDESFVGEQEADAIESIAPSVRLLLVVHDAHDHGAQQNALHMAKSLTQRFRVDLDILILGEGALWPEFARWGRVHDLARQYVTDEDRESLLRELWAAGAEAALCNTTVSGRLVPLLKRCGYRVVTLVHELPQLISDYRLREVASNIAAESDVIVFASEYVRDKFVSVAGDLHGRAVIMPQGLYRQPYSGDRERIRDAVRRELGVSDDTAIVLGVGYADRRKGFDIYADVVARVGAASAAAVTFLWVGAEDPGLIRQATDTVRRAGALDRLQLRPRTKDVARYYAASDVFVLPSREDPFPSVVLEAMAHELPVVAFRHATGMERLLERVGALVVPHADAEQMASAVRHLLSDPQLRQELGARARAVVDADFCWEDYLYSLLHIAGHSLRRISVIVPNFNYARYLPERLGSIYAQTYPLRDVIVLDDASTDESLSVLESLAQDHGWEFTVIGAAANSGSVFRQWLAGAQRARGELLWIAEADDVAEPSFLEKMAPAFDDPRTVMAYCDSKQIDENGAVVAPDYLHYVRDIDPSKWQTSWTRPGLDELAESFAVRNTAPNVSAVLFDRRLFLEVLRESIDEISSFRVAGDYAVYVRLLSKGGHLAFLAESLNRHRRHQDSVTKGAFGARIVTEIASVQRLAHNAVPVSPATRVLAAQYLAQLRRQFGLSTMRDRPNRRPRR